MTTASLRIRFTGRFYQADRKAFAKGRLSPRPHRATLGGRVEDPAPHSSSQWLLLAQFLEEQTDRFDSAMEVGDVKLLVRSVQIVIGQAETHHHAWNLQHVLKIG